MSVLIFMPEDSMEIGPFEVPLFSRSLQGFLS